MLAIQQGLTNVNYNSRGTTPQWIVLHYTANNGDTAKNNIDYFRNTFRGASANYFVDPSSIWQCVRDTDTAWHVGNDWYNNGARNTNAIGIEMCSLRKASASANDLSAYYLDERTVTNAVELTQYLMKKYNIPIERVCRHYDVTGKICPAPFYYNNGATTWSQFLARVKNTGDLTVSQYNELNKKIDDNVKWINDTMAQMREAERTNTKNIQTLTAKHKTYDTIDKVPSWYQEAVKYWVGRGVIKGTSATTLGLTEDQCKLATMMYRNELLRQEEQTT